MNNDNKRTCAGCPIYLDCNKTTMATASECLARKIWRSKVEEVFSLETKLAEAEELLLMLRKAHILMIRQITNYEKS